jgi:pimeloyl-ACP methyl ester carboxylesterase
MSTRNRRRRLVVLLAALLLGVGAQGHAQKQESSKGQNECRAGKGDYGKKHRGRHRGANRCELSIAEQGYFFVNGKYYTTSDGTGFLANQTYVEYQIPKNLKHRYPIVFFPGGGQTGTNFMGTPDGRPGWGQFFLANGYAVYILDEVGRGKAPWSVDLYGPLPGAGRYTNAERRFTAIEQFNLWPQAHLHTQWPGAGVHGDRIFDQFLASQTPSIPSADQEAQQKTSGAELLDRIGPAILLTHSMSGPYGWQVADARPRLVKGLLQIEPNGPPFYGNVETGPPDWFEDGSFDRPWGITRNAITYSPAVTDPADLGPAQEAQPQGPDLVRCWKQTEPAHQLINLKNVPVLIIASEASYHAPYDHCTSQYLTQAGVENTLIHLGDVGVHGNGHMMMLEKNNLDIAAVMLGWLEENVEEGGKGPKH